MDLTVTTENIQTRPESYYKIKVELEGVDKDEVLSQLSIKDFLDYFDVNDILDEIGQSECEDYFGLVEKEDD